MMQQYFPSFVDEVSKLVKTAWDVSEYSGELTYGRFKQESHIPPFHNPPVKTAGPPPPKTKKAEQVQGMAPTGTQTMGPQVKYSPTKQLNASRRVAEVEPTKPSGKSGFHLNVKLPGIGTPL